MPTKRPRHRVKNEILSLLIAAFVALSLVAIKAAPAAAVAGEVRIAKDWYTIQPVEQAILAAPVGGWTASLTVTKTIHDLNGDGLLTPADVRVTVNGSDVAVSAASSATITLAAPPPAGAWVVAYYTAEPLRAGARVRVSVDDADLNVHSDSNTPITNELTTISGTTVTASHVIGDRNHDGNLDEDDVGVYSYTESAFLSVTAVSGKTVTVEAGYDSYDVLLDYSYGVTPPIKDLNSLRVIQRPIVDRDGDGEATAADVTVNCAEHGLISDEVIGVTSADGMIWLDGKTDHSADSVRASYMYATANATGVNLKSTSQPAGIPLSLKETGANTGVFDNTVAGATGYVTLVSAVVDAATQLRAAAGDTITATYADARPAANAIDTATAETSKPVIADASPSHNTFTKGTRPALAIDIMDTGSGVALDRWRLYIYSTAIASPPAADLIEAGILVASEHKTAIANGWHLEWTISKPGREALDEGIYHWFVTAEDIAGNIATSDALAGGAANGYLLGIDNTPPLLSAATTGVWWDAGTNALGTPRSYTTIQLAFDEELDPATVSRADFEVDAIPPLAERMYAPVYSIPGAPSTLIDGSGYRYVYLTVPTLATDAQPKVELVGTVRDLAGNTASAGLIPAAADGLAPLLEVSATPHLGGPGQAITITATSSERLAAPPTAKVSHTQDGEEWIDASLQPTMLLSGTNQWTGTYPVANTAKHKVVITGLDVAGNDSSAAAYFEGDTLCGPVVLRIGNDILAWTITTNVYVDNPTIDIDFALEGAEYPDDSHGTVALSQVTLDNVDVTALVSTTDNVTFTLATSGLAVGSHSISVVARDEAGNTSSNARLFSITPMPSVSIELMPGLNLISVPKDPIDPSIATIFADFTSIDRVFTYEAGAWLTAYYDPATKAWSNELTSIVAGKGYWVHTGQAITLVINLKLPEAGDEPPAYDIVTGWNLIGFSPPGGATSADIYHYLSNLRDETGAPIWIGLHRYRPDVGYETATPDTGFDGLPMAVSTEERLVQGQGYWIEASAPGALSP